MVSGGFEEKVSVSVLRGIDWASFINSNVTWLSFPTLSTVTHREDAKLDWANTSKIIRT